MNQADFVYFIQEGNSDHFKIGITRGNVTKRLKAIQAHNSQPLTVRYTIGPLKSNSAWVIEMALHNKFAERHIRGEWFVMPELANITGDSHIKKWIAAIGYPPGEFSYGEINTPGLQISVEPKTRRVAHRTFNGRGSYTLRGELYKRVYDAAKRLGVSQNQAVRLAIIDWLEHNHSEG